MTLVLIIDLAAIILLCVTAFRDGFERVLPLAAFLIVIFPFECQIVLPGLFDFTTQRVVVVTLVVLYIVLGRQKRPDLPLKSLILLLMGWMLVSTFNSVVFTTSLKAVLSQFFDFFVVYYIFAKSISKSQTVKRIALGLVAGMFVCSTLGFIEAYWNWSVMTLFPAAFHTFAALGGMEDRGGRVQSSFGHAILFGGALAMTMPIALYLAMEAKTAAGRAFLWCTILLMFVCLFKSMSRGPWIAAIASVGLSLIGGGKKMRQYGLVIVALTVLTLVIRPGVWESISNLYGETLNPDTAQGASYQWRYALYHAAFQHLDGDLGRAMWGYGPESFLYLGWKGDFQGAVVPFDSCDSSIAALMIETGYVGFLIATVLFLTAVWYGFRSYLRMPSPQRRLSLVLVSSTLAFLFLMSNVAILGWGQQSYILWMLLALIMVYPGLAREENRRLRVDKVIVPDSSLYEVPSPALPA